MCPPGGPPGHPVASRVPHQHAHMQQAPAPQQVSNFGPMPPQGNYEQMMQMLHERQERIKAVMNDPANQQQLPQLRMQLAQNTQEIENLNKQQKARHQSPIFYQQQQHQPQMQAYGPGSQPGGPPHMMQQGPPNQQGPHPGYMDMNAQHQAMMHHPNAPPGSMHQQQQQPVMNKSQSIAAWQHQNYMLDSGLNSGHSTAPPSLCSNGTGNELLDDDADSVYSSHASWSGSAPGYPQACYTPEQYENFNGPRSVGMYYENGPNSIPCETPSYPSPQTFDPNNPQQVPPNMVVQQGPSGQQQQMGPQGQQQMPRQTLKDAISQIAQMLVDTDAVVQLQAAETAQAMAKNPQNRSAIIQSSQMIQNLVNALNSDSEEIVRCAAGTLHDLSQMKPGESSCSTF